MAYNFTQTYSELQNIVDLAENYLATVYDSSTSYVIGDYCTYSGVLYKCTASTTGTFDANDWDAVTVGDELLLRGAQYEVGDTVKVYLAQYPGSWVSNNTCRWFIPLAKPISSNVSGASITAGAWVVRGINGAITVDGNTTDWTAALSTNTLAIRENGIYIVSEASANTSGMNNTPVVVQTGSGFTVTFS